jgi:hypothetical protein
MLSGPSSGSRRTRTRKASDFGGQIDEVGRYTKLHVISVGSKSRHVPASARIAEPPSESDQTWTRVTDVRTTEMHIHTAAMPQNYQLNWPA